MFAKIEDGIVVQYPIDQQFIRQQFPNTSFPAEIVPPEPYVRVIPTGRPQLEEDEDCYESTPVYMKGNWFQAWTITKLTEEQYTAKKTQAVETKLQHLAYLRWQLQYDTIEYNDYLFRTDSESIIQYQYYAQNGLYGSWKVSNGVFVDLTPDDFKALVAKIQSRTMKLFLHEQMLTNKILSFETVKEIEGFNVETFLDK